MSQAGKWILGGVAVATIVNGYLADWNHTHLFNSRWPAHAKFHDAWTILLGSGLGLTSLAALRKGDTGTAALLPALYYATQLGSFAFPNTAGLEAEFPDRVPRIAGLPLNESVASVAMLAMTTLGYTLARDSAR